MSDTKNDEKLRILQERLAQIKQKQDTPESISQKKDSAFSTEKKSSGFSTEKKGSGFSTEKKDDLTDASLHKTSADKSLKVTKKERNPLDLSWIKKAVIVGSVAYGIFYGYTNIDFNSLVPSFSEEENSEELVSNQLEYKFNLIGNNIAIINTQNSMTDEGSAKAMVNDLKVKGFKCNYFYLPENSNLTDEVYQVFIGPYENEKETNQWAKNLEAEFNIITL